MDEHSEPFAGLAALRETTLKGTTMQKIAFEVCERKERKKIAEKRFVSPNDAEADVAHWKEQSLRVLEEARKLDRGSGFLPRPLQKIVDALLAGAEYLYIMLHGIRKNDVLRGRHLVAPRVETPMEELIETARGRRRPSPGNAPLPEEYEQEVDAGL